MSARPVMICDRCKAEVQHLEFADGAAICVKCFHTPKPTITLNVGLEDLQRRVELLELRMAVLEKPEPLPQTSAVANTCPHLRSSWWTGTEGLPHRRCFDCGYTY